MKKILLTFAMIAIVIMGRQITTTFASSPTVRVSGRNALAITVRSQALVIDHTTVDITAVPQQYIEAAKNDLNIYYGHTSHGSQLMYGMDGLVSFANGGGLGLSLPQDIFEGLYVRETSPDAGYYPTWVDNTRNYLGIPDPVTGRGTDHPEINVVIWSWCGQVSSISEQDLLYHYLLPMTQLESDYPDITFVYMTGHSDGSGDDPVTSNLHARNQQIRQYAIDNNKVLYDFYDIELYDPDGTYFGDQNVDDGCNYDSGNWCTEWQSSHTEGVDWYSVDCAHSQSINCNQKAYAAWWLWARLAGWNEQPDLSSSSKSASQSAVQVGDTLTYTIQIINDTGVLTNTLSLTDTIPAGLAYIPGSLLASSGTADESNAPTLSWTGVLTPTPEISVTYAVTVTVVTPQAITNTAILQIPGYESISRSATIIANGYQVYLPLIRR